MLALFRPCLKQLEKYLTDANVNFHFECELDVDAIGADVRQLDWMEVINSAYDRDNHGLWHEATIKNIADVLIDALSIKFNHNLAQVQVLKQETQSGKSAVEQALMILIPALDYCVTGQTTYPLMILPPFTQHGEVMIRELTFWAALLSTVSVSYNGSQLKPLKMLHDYANICGDSDRDKKRPTYCKDGIIIRTHARFDKALQGNLRKRQALGCQRVFVMVDECHRGSGEGQIYPEILKALREEQYLLRTLLVSATPTECQALEVRSLIKETKGTVGDGYRYFDGASGGHIIANGESLPLRLEVHSDYFEDRYGLTLSLDPAAYEKEVRFRDKHLADVVAADLALIQDHRHILNRFPNIKAATSVHDVLKERIPEGVTLIPLYGKLDKQYLVSKDGVKYGTIAECVDDYLTSAKVILLVVDRCQMSHRYSAALEVAIDFRPVSSRDETVKQGLGGRMTGYNNDPLLLLSDSSFSVHSAIQQRGQSVGAGRKSSGRTQYALTDEFFHSKRKETSELWWQDYHDVPLMQSLQRDITDCLRKQGTQARQNDSGQLSRLNDEILTSEIRDQLSILLNVEIAHVGAATVANSVAPTGEGGWSFRFATKETFILTEKTPRTKNVDFNGTLVSRGSLIWTFDNADQTELVAGESMTVRELYRLCRMPCNAARRKAIFPDRLSDSAFSDAELQSRFPSLSPPHMICVGITLPLRKDPNIVEPEYGPEYEHADIVISKARPPSFLPDFAAAAVKSHGLHIVRSICA
jgi:hypothetical protein